MPHDSERFRTAPNIRIPEDACPMPSEMERSQAAPYIRVDDVADPSSESDTVSPACIGFVPNGCCRLACAQDDKMLDKGGADESSHFDSMSEDAWSRVSAGSVMRKGWLGKKSP